MAVPKIDKLQALVDNICRQSCERILVRSLSACIQCGACERACKKRNQPAPLSGRWDKCGATELAPVCRNCALPSCVKVCPRQAMVKKGRRVVLVTERCVGCGLCVKACAFSVIRIEAAVVSNNADRKFGKCKRRPVKCSGCETCVRECPTGSLRFLPFKKVIRMALTGSMVLPIKLPVRGNATVVAHFD